MKTGGCGEAKYMNSPTVSLAGDVQSKLPPAQVAAPGKALKALKSEITWVQITPLPLTTCVTHLYE